MFETPSDQARLLDSAVLRRFFSVFLGATLALFLIVLALYRQDVHHRRTIFEQEAHYVVALEREFLLLEFRSVQSDLLYLAQQVGLKRFLSGEGAGRADLEREYRRFALNKGIYDQIRFLDSAGDEVVRINYGGGDAEIVPPDQLQTKANRYYYRQALSLDEGEVLVSPFDLNVEREQIQQPIKPVIRFLTPVFDASGEKRGLLVLNYLGAHLLEKLKEISAGLRGTTMLVNSAGEYLQARNPDHEWGWMRGHPYKFRTHFPEAWERGRSLESGQFRIGHDLFTLQRVSPADRSLSDPARSKIVENEREASCLVIVSHIPDAVATASSLHLLKQLLLLLLGTLVPVGVLSFYGARSGVIRRSHEQRIAESEARLRQLSSLLLAAQEDERRNLSRDLHDELGQQVTAIRLDLRSMAKESSSPRARTLLQRAIGQTDQLLKSLHKIATRVRPSVLDDLGLHDAVESFLAEYQQRTGIEVACELRFHRENLPPAVVENVYRILQEALSNVAKHAGAETVSVLLEADEDALRMTVQDSGIGFQPERPEASDRLGVLGMRERAELLNGQFEVVSAPGEGTRIRLAIPLGDERS